jgi:hypothetical protein
MQQSPSAFLERYWHESAHTVTALACNFRVGLIHVRDGYVEIAFPFERFHLRRAWEQDPPRTFIDVLHTLAVLLSGSLATEKEPGPGDADEIRDWGDSWRALERHTQGSMPERLRPPPWQDVLGHATTCTQAWLEQPRVQRAIEGLTNALLRCPVMMGDTAVGLCREFGLPTYYWTRTGPRSIQRLRGGTQQPRRDGAGAGARLATLPPLPRSDWRTMFPAQYYAGMAGV